MNGEGLTFDWDKANQEHLARHEVTPTEAEEAILGDPLDIEMQVSEGSSGEERLLQIGETARGRILQLTTTWRGEKVRVISAWEAPRQLKLYYLAEMRKIYGDSEDSEV
jgi:uncharacterized DUF497 family protein